MERKDYYKTKIAIPQTLHQLLPRKSISAAINSAVLDEAVFFVAPYGYGKTLAVVSWLRECGKEAAWITFDSSDNTEPVFIAGLSAAILRLTGWPGDVNDVLSDPRYIESQEDFLWEAVSTAENTVQDKILVLDAFQFIKTPALLRVIKNVISGLLGRWRVIIMSRGDLPPAFTELFLKGNIRLITPKELSFSTEEMTEFYNMYGCAVSREDALTIWNETEGWPASLNVVLTISLGSPAVYGDAARAYLMDYFEEEIWDSLQDNVKEFLLKTSILDQLTPPVCRAVTDSGESISLLRWLFSNGLFINKLNERDTYQYHRVFQDFLRDKLAASDLDERELYKKFAWWLYDNNEIVQSFPFFFQAGDLYGVSQVLKTVDLMSMDLDGFLELTDCITTLNAEDLKPYPVIVARMALIAYLKGNINKMHELQRVYDEWHASDAHGLSSDEYAEYLSESGWLSYLDPDEPTRANPKHLTYGNYRYYAPHLKALHLARGSMLNFPSLFRGRRDYGDDGIFETEAILERVERGEKYILDEEEAVWKTYIILAEYKYEIEEFARAEEIVRRVMTLVEDRGYTDLYFCCTVLLVKLMRAAHDANEIDALTIRLKTMIMKNGHTFLLPNFHAFEQRNRLATGQPGLMDVFEEENKDLEHKPYFFLIYRQFTYARVLLSTGGYNQALSILGNLELLCERYKRPTDLIEVNVLKSAALYNLGREDDACRHLKEAIAAAERYGYLRIFSDDAAHIGPVLELLQKQAKGKYIQSIIISCKKTLARSGYKPLSKKAAPVGLTKTERVILIAVQNGMPYGEIAQDNGIRLSTVKSHIHSIYSKLDVHNKTAAIIAAQNMGIL